MAAEGPTFAVLGTGNAGQTFAADIALKGFSVNLAEVPQFADSLHAIKSKGGIEINGEAGSGFARFNMYTTDIAKAVKGVDIIIIGGSAFAHEPISKALIDKFEDGQFVLFTSNFSALRFHQWMIEAGAKTHVTPVESASLLYATRAVAPGVVSCLGVKSHLPVAALPARRTKEFIAKISPVFPQFEAADNVLFTSINNMNPIVHPPMVLFNAGRIESMEGHAWNLYADGATESVVKIMLAMDKERMALLDLLGIQGITFKDTFKYFYQDYALEGNSLSEILRRSPIHSDPAMPAPSVVKTRYIEEDLPFGLTAWSSMGRQWGLAMPNIDTVIQIASVMLDTAFYKDGITPDKLGINGLSPEETVALVS